MKKLKCNTPPHQQDIVRFGPPSPPKSRASTQVFLTVLFLAATHDPKTRLTSQCEHALIRPWLWTLASDVGSYNPPTLRQAILGSNTKCNTPPHQQDIVRFGPPSPPKSRASTQVPLTVLFVAATHGPKTRLTSQGEHALIRPWLWTLASDVGSYIYIIKKHDPIHINKSNIYNISHAYGKLSTHLTQKQTTLKSRYRRKSY